MSFLVRRINRPKWKCENENDVFADAVTSCLRTQNNAISVWKIDTIEQLNNAVLALITGAKQTKLSKIDCVLLDENIVLEKGLVLDETNGDTVVEDLVNTHKDIEKLTYSKLGVLKDLILERLETDKYRLFSIDQLREILKKAIEDGRVDITRLNEDFVKNEKLV